MPQSLSKIYLHLIFHIKTTSPKIRKEDLENLHAYIGELVNTTKCVNIWVDGTEDHVHAFLLLGRETTVAHLVEEMKRNSSRWIKTLSPHYRLFEWQGGYAVFSVSESISNKVLEYVKNQQEHHKTQTFEEEYLRFLKLHGVEYNEQYVFAD